MTLVSAVEAQGCLKLPNGREVEYDDTRFHSILFGGDQLTAARIRGIQALRATEERRIEELTDLMA